MRADGVADAVLLRALDASPDAVVLFTPTAEVVYANEAVTPVFGRTPAELLGTNIAALLHPDDVGSALASIDAFDDQGVRPRTAALMRFRWPDGSYAALEVNGNPVSADDGTTLYSMFARRAEERRLMVDTVALLADDFDVPSALDLVYQQWSWSLDAALTTIVWTDEDGGRHGVGDQIPAALTVLGSSDAPWHAAWEGHDVVGDTSDLPNELASMAAARGLWEYRAHPVVDDGAVRAVLMLWTGDASHPMAVFASRLQFISRLIQLTLRFHRQQRRLRHDAAHDSLTGLANRRTFYAALAPDGAVDGPEVVVPTTRRSAVGPVRRHGHPAPGRPTAVLYVDLDGFKPVNDRWGHQVGDAVLEVVAARLAASCRTGDLVARLGGDEFAILCVDCTAAEAGLVAERILASVAAPIAVEGSGVEVQASIGVAVEPGGDAGVPRWSPRELASAADRALYDAKRAGGQRVVFAELGDGDARLERP